VETEAQGGGDECEGPAKETRSCNMQECQTSTTFQLPASSHDDSVEAPVSHPEVADETSPEEEGSSVLLYIVGGATILCVGGVIAYVSGYGRGSNTAPENEEYGLRSQNWETSEDWQGYSEDWGQYTDSQEVSY